MAQGSPFVVNTTTADNQSDAVKGTSIFVRRFNAAGVAQGSPFLVNTTTTGNQSDPAVSMDADGNFVVVWTSSGQDGSGYGVYGQRFNSSGDERQRFDLISRQVAKARSIVEPEVLSCFLGMLSAAPRLGVPELSN